jgi:ankyrin repeat protein
MLAGVPPFMVVRPLLSREPPLHYAAGLGDLRLLRLLLIAGMHSIDTQFQGRTALMCAVEARSYVCAELLLNADADPDARPEDPARMCPLRYAVEFCGWRELAELLIDQGACPHLRTTRHCSAYEYVEAQLLSAGDADAEHWRALLRCMQEAE